MTYLALYRQWRPQNFSRVAGQDHIVKTLKNALRQESLSHAYLFCGPRGTGKTTVAKLLAKAVNCPQLRDGEPCNQCPGCRKITEGSSVDVLEIDAASNRGIDEIRDLKERVKYAPAEARRKVYIIDEVHMLTNEAFNALLKTLEEPPAHVLFILATTEPHKVPVTILSRCQRFDFHRFTASEIAGQLEQVVVSLGVETEPEALAAISRAAEGGMRDALSLLDQVLSFGGSRITLADVLSVLGSVPGQVLAEMASAVAARDITSVLRTVGELARQGKDLRQLLRDLTSYFRDLLLFSLEAGAAVELSLAPEEEETLRCVSRKFSSLELAAVLRTLAEAEGEMRWAAQPRLILELALIKSLHRGEVHRGDGAPAAAPAAPALAPAPPPAPQALRGEPVPGKEDGESAASAAQKWPAILEWVRARKVTLYALLQEAAPVGLEGRGQEGRDQEGRDLVIAFNHRFHRDQAAKPENRALVEKAVEEIFGRKVGLNLILKDDQKRPDKEALREHPEIKKILGALGGEIVEIKEE